LEVRSPNKFDTKVSNKFRSFMQKNHKILIIGWFKFPFGSAAASRITTLAQGLNETGFEVFVVTTARIPLRVNYLGKISNTKLKIVSECPPFPAHCSGVPCSLFPVP
jgi:hypothetical protein